MNRETISAILTATLEVLRDFPEPTDRDVGPYRQRVYSLLGPIPATYTATDQPGTGIFYKDKHGN